MPSLIYDSFWDDLARGNIDADTDTFYCMLVTAAYVENKAAHAKRSDVTNEVAAAGGYVAGGFAVAVGVTKDTVNNREEISLGPINIPNATVAARKAVYYKHRGGAANLDELVAVIDFGADVASTNGTWSLTASTIRLQN